MPKNTHSVIAVHTGNYGNKHVKLRIIDQYGAIVTKAKKGDGRWWRRRLKKERRAIKTGW